MQPLIQHNNKQFSLEKTCYKIKKTTLFFFVSGFLPEIYKKYQKLSGHAVSQLLQFLTLNLCGYWSRVGSRDKKVIISNLSSALRKPIYSNEKRISLSYIFNISLLGPCSNLYGKWKCTGRTINDVLFLPMLQCPCSMHRFLKSPAWLAQNDIFQIYL